MAASGEGAGRLVRERGRGLTYMQDDPLKGGVTVARRVRRKAGGVRGPARRRSVLERQPYACISAWPRLNQSPEKKAVDEVAGMTVVVAHDLDAAESADRRAEGDVARPMRVVVHTR